MKRSKIVAILTAVIVIAFTSAASAQEQEGFIKRLFFRLRGEKPKTAAVPVEEESTAIPSVPIPTAEIAETTAEEKKGGEEIAAKEMSTAEMVESIKEMLDGEDDLLAAIPELKKEEGGFYTYSGVKLEDLDREKLNTVFSRIQNEIGRIRAERLSQQLESIRQAQQANMAVQQAARIPAVLTPPPKPPQVPQPPPSPPQVPTVQQQYQPPSSPPQVPRQPPQPPAPPRR